MKYNILSHVAGEFINDEEIMNTLEYASENKNNLPLIREVLEKGRSVLVNNFKNPINHREAALLLLSEDPVITNEIKTLAREIKTRFYGNRIVLFAPLYLSNYCINGCVYCPYHSGTKKCNTHITRKKLSQEEIRNEVIALENMGHKRLALESGEDPLNSPIEYILESIKTVYETKSANGSIRRVNVNIAATNEKEYKLLREAGIGTYILFQETYKKSQYETLHPFGPKSDYDYHTEAMDRAMEAGINDVGSGVLYGLYDYRYDFVGQVMHAEHLEKVFGTGPHTISLPRVRRATGIDTKAFPYAVDDETFEKIVATMRVAVPYTGMIISTRENKECREKVLPLGVSQISGGSRTSVGGYVTEEHESEQFNVEDTRTLSEVIGWLLSLGYVPSFCTACYREGRTGERFMHLLKTGNISNCCTPNALLTLEEYLSDYASGEMKQAGEKIVARELQGIPNEKVRKICSEYIEKIKNGERDFRF